MSTPARGSRYKTDKKKEMAKVKSAHLPKEEYVRLMASGPIPAVDMVITDRDGKVLLGRRTDHPAQGFWFVPGGRLLRDETVSEAVRRISTRELGVALEPGRGLGVFHHRHPTDAVGAHTGCHFVVLSVAARWPSELPAPVPADGSHEALRFFHVHDLLRDHSVHQLTKNYFLPSAPNCAFSS